jgi:hypothetical protein
VITLTAARSDLIGPLSHHRSFKLVILSPALLTEKTSDRFDDDHLVADDRGNCKGPHQTAAGL